jgi:uncharacterized repeat protein (TIGR01451 family)
MIRSITRVALGGLMSLALAAPALAQSTSTDFTLNGLTREGTEIVNTATATYTDANGNSYDQLSASVTVVVGFLANLDVFTQQTQAPSGPSSDNTLGVTITNNGNGSDLIQLNTAVPDGITNVRYELNGVIYASLAELNAAINVGGFAADAVITVTVLYDVLDGFGGQQLNFEVSVTSTRAPDQDGGSDSSTTIITPVRSDGVNVAPDGATSERLPSNGTVYTETFTVSNTGNATETFDLTASLPAGAVVTIVSVNGTAGSTSTVTIDASQSATVTVTYTVADDALAGTANMLTLTATAQSNSTISDDGTIQITVIRPAVTMTKEAYQNGRTVLFGSGMVLPGQFIEYKITVTNNGTTTAKDVVITDALPLQVEYVSSEAGAGNWTIVRSGNAGTVGNTVTATLDGTMAPGTTRHIWIRTQVR